MIMLNDKQNTIQLAEAIALNLVFRDSAIDLFKLINKSKQSRLLIDFQDVQSITRSFAHQYLKLKEQSEKTIIHINVAPDIQRMFELITLNSDIKTFSGKKD